MTPDQRIESLEYRLADYHERLTDSIAERDRLALDAVCGVHSALCSGLAAVVIFGGAFIAVKQGSWPAAIAVGVVWLIALFIIHSWSNGQRMKGVERLAELPDWESG